LPLALVMAVGSASPQAPDANADEQREKLVMDRFLGVLEKNPRRGTALDRLYGYHVERGTLDKFVATFTDRTKKDPADGTAWMLIGLVEAQRGKEANAVTAFKQAEQHRPDDALACYYLGQSLVMVGQPDAAAQAFERAIQRKPNRTDLLDIFQALGRVYQRAQKTEQALAVWARLEKQFPDDLRVQEQIASTLVEEGQFEQALPRYDKLAKAVQDAYRQSTFRMEAAELKVRLKRTPDALTDLENLLGELNPDSWLYRDVRRRIDDVFLRNDDLAGMAKYYEAYVGKHPHDVEAMARLARSLATQGRVPESREWLKKAVEKAPTRRELRQAMIDQFAAEQKYADAIAQYEAMDKAEPNNPDTLRDWGKMILRDQSKPEADRKQAAFAIWKRLLDRRPNDPVATAQVADLARAAGLSDQAVELYKKAVEYAPNAAQYREYLGEYLHSLKRKDEALAAWRPIAEGANRNAKNLQRLGEVLAGFGYRKEALAALADALSLEKDDFNLIVRYADLLHQDEKHEEALAQLESAIKLASNAEEVESVLQAQIKIFTATDTLTQRTDELQTQLKAGQDATTDRWHRLARYYEASKLIPDATTAILKAVEKDPKSIPVLSSAARIHESGGNLLAAAETLRQLAGVDRRFRTEYLTNVAKLEARLGRREQALQAGKDLLAAAPGNPENFKFYADLCFQLGEGEEGLESLRKSVRVNPSDPQGLITLAQALAERFRTGEAIELLWRAFEKTNDLDGKAAVVARLTELYLQNNQFDKLMERLERERREADKQREMTICIAQAYQTAGDLGTARQQLERLLTENARDTQLLGQLSQLAENEGDNATALKYQRQLEKAAPTNRDVRLRLAQLLVKTGESEEAATIWVDLVANEHEPYRNHQAIDAVISAGKHDAALAVLTRLISNKPTDWELIYREAVTLSALNKKDEAAKRFHVLLDLKLTDETESAAAKWRKKQKPGRQSGMSLSSTQTSSAQAAYQQMFQSSATAFQPEAVPLQARIYAVSSIRRDCGLDFQRPYYGPNSQQMTRIWVPDDFGQARMAALGWLYAFAQKDNKQDEFTQTTRTAKEKGGADSRQQWDWLYFQMIKQDQKGTWEAAKEMAGVPDPSAAWVFLSNLSSRTGTNRRVSYSRRNSEGVDTVPPLGDAELQQVVAAFRRVRQQKPEWVTTPILTNVLKELKRAKRPDDGDAIYKEVLAAAVKPEQIQQVLSLSAERGDVDGALVLFDRLGKLPPTARNNAPRTRDAVQSLSLIMRPRAEAKAHADLIKVFETYLASQRRYRLSNPPKSATSASQQMSQWNMQMPGGYYQSVAVDYPPANDYYDLGSIQLLRTAFEHYKQADLVSDMITLVKQKLDAAPAGEKIEWQLGLGYLYWWNQEKEQAITELTAAAGLVPNDVNMKFDLASLREKNNEPDEALTILDSITPLDHTAMQRKEESALKLAVRTGNVDRARQAADRLFGLRLDAEKQVELASQMHRLGMHEAAEAVLGRASRQAGNRTAALVRLMNQYQSQNQPDLAIQIARQLLRKGPSMNFTPYRYSGDENEGRDSAIQVLARSGKLNEMIERAEAQVKASPKALPAYQTLVDYYKAAGDKEKLKATALKMIEVKPDDAKMRFQVAQQFQNLGDHKAAAEQYLAAIKKEPSLFSYNYWYIMQTFQQAKMWDELTKVFDELDAKTMGGQYYAYMQIVQPLLSQEKTREQGLKLFRKAWQAFPDSRQWMMQYLHDDSLWSLPELYAFAKEAVVPGAEMFPDTWQGSDQVINYANDGRTTGLFTRLLDMARRQNRLVSLGREVDEALKRHPSWSAGRALKVILDLQQGKRADARKAWLELVDNKKDPMPGMAGFLFGQEIEHYSAMHDLVRQTYEKATEEAIRDEYDLSYSPVRRLVKLYEQEDRKADAKALIQRCLKQRTDDRYDPGYAAYQKMSSTMSAASMFQELGFTVEAVRMYAGLLDDADTLDMAMRYWGGGGRTQVEQGLKQALKALKPEQMPESVRELLQPRENAKTGQALDLMVMVPNRTLTETTVTSVLAQALEATAKTPELRGEALAKLAELCGRLPRDFSVQVAAALLAVMDDKSDKSAEAVERLVRLVEETPLEPLPANGRANSRQRVAAQPQIALWLVARECLKKDALRPQGVKLGERALAAAKRQLESTFSLAILREWGQIDSDRGDKLAAEKRWGEMLELVIPPPAPKKAAKLNKAIEPEALARDAGGKAARNPSLALRAQSRSQPRTPSLIQTLVASVLVLQVPAPPAPAKGAPPPPPAATPARSSPMVPVVTIGQFEQARQIATMATDKNMHALAQKSIRDALRGGPPVNNPQPADPRGRIYYSYGSQPPPSADTANPFGGEVETAVAALVGKWKRAGVPAAELYDTLAAVVMPDARPAEVFLYVRPMQYTFQEKPRSLGILLAETAAAAGKLDDLRRRAEARQAQPLGELSARVLLAQAAFAGKDKSQVPAQLDWFTQRMQKDTLQNTAELIAHVALPLLDHAEWEAVERASAALLDKAAKNLSNSRAERQANGLMLQLARHQFAKNRPEEAKALLKDVSARATKNSLKSGSGDAGIVQQAQQVAREFIRGGMLADALELIGFAVDLPPTQQRYVSTDMLGDLTGVFYRQFVTRPAQERFDLLKPWSLPTTSRKSVRLLGAFVPTDAPPPAFATPKVPPDGVVSTAGLLIDAAKEIGQLDALATELKKLVDEKVENARPIHWLAELVRGQGSGVVNEIGERVAELKKKNDEPPPPPQTGPRYYYGPFGEQEEQKEIVNWSDYLVTRACMQDAGLAGLGEAFAEQMLRQATRAKNWPMIIQLRNELALAKARRGGKPQAGNLRDPGLEFWHAGGTLGRGTRGSSRVPAWWVAQEGHVAHLLGPDMQYLVFDLPLTGNFGFSVDAFEGQFAEGHAGYAGIIYEANQGQAPSTVWPVGKHEQQYHPAESLRFETFNRFTFDVAGQKVMTLINGRRFHEIGDNAPTSPWLTLFCSRERNTVFRDFKLTGTPEIPREVRLVDGDRITGWVGTLYGDSQPPRLRKEDQYYQYYYDEGDYEYDPEGNPRQRGEKVYDWQAKDGVLEGRRIDDPAASVTPSHLGYFRPLRPGETLRYEFFYKPGETEVHPCLGRLAFLLAKDGVQLRWLTEGGDDDWTGLSPDNTRSVAEHRRGPKDLPLKNGDWNTLAVKMGAAAATLELNGTVIYELPLADDDDRSFGLYHDKGKSNVRVRNIVLTGDWPKTVPAGVLRDMLVRGPAESMDGPTRRALVGESYFMQGARPTLLAARALPAAERYAKLAAFVLPGPDRNVFQLAADHSPTNPVPSAVTPRPESSRVPSAPLEDSGRGVTKIGSRDLLGGDIEAPALELVSVAKELNKLPELLAKVESADPKADPRGRLALLAIVQAALGNDAAATDALNQLKPLAEKMPFDAPTWRRWPELIAAAGTLSRPACAAAAGQLLDVPVKQGRAIVTSKFPMPNADSFLLTAHALRGRAAQPAATFGSDPRLAFWAPVTHQTAATSGSGRPAPLWVVADGGVRRYPGHNVDALYFRSPLRGEFEVQAELTTFDWREAYLGYGGARFEVKHDRKSFDMYAISNKLRSGKIDPPLPELGESYKYRLVIKDGSWKAFINDREVCEEPLPADADPWLALSTHAGNTAGFRNLKIVGTPTIPDSLDLLGTSALSNWQPYGGEMIATEYGSWNRRGEELNGIGLYQQSYAWYLAKKPPRSWTERALFYHRPMLEDGTIDYEFYYEPEKTLVHPALDRLCLLLDAKGVRIHWLTDGPNERTDLKPDNATTEPAHRRGPAELPLKAKAWNKVTLSLAGDTLTLKLNDVEIYQRPVEPGNQRTFGFFHYADETSARVRNVVYKGQWPKTLPKEDEMFRAAR
jgi:tetratricopeptide (TPR) repeat protein